MQLPTSAPLSTSGGWGCRGRSAGGLGVLAAAGLGSEPLLHGPHDVRHECGRANFSCACCEMLLGGC